MDYLDSSVSREKMPQYNQRHKLSSLKSPYDLEFSNQLLRHNFNVELISNTADSHGSKTRYKIRRIKQHKKRSPFSSKLYKKLSQDKIHFNSTKRTECNDKQSNY